MILGRPLPLCLGVAILFVGIGQRAAAQDFKLKPNYGETTLKTDYEPDPFKKEVVAGGDKVVTKENVKMKITNAPDFRLQFTAGDKYPLSFYVRSDADTTLLIRTPDGKWLADDDTGGNLNPLITIKKPMSGEYNIWVGTFGDKQAKAVLHITELKVETPIPNLSAK
jgi:serine protease Do